MSYATPSPGTRLRQLIKQDKVIVAPGVYDGVSARYALNNGFDCLYMTGAGVSMSRIGWADLGLATQTEMVDTARMIANLDPSVPLIADADTGYGSPANVARTVQLYINAGVAGFHLEDQVVNKKCGHLGGKECVSREVYLARIKAAVLTRDKLGSDIVIIARTDALQQLGLDEALGRIQDAVKIGADVVMLEAATEKHEVEAVCRMFKGTVPVLYGMVQGSKSYKMSPSEAYQLGIKIMIYAAACILPTYLAVNKDLRTLKSGDCEDHGPECTPHKVFHEFGMSELIQLDKDSACTAK